MSAPRSKNTLNFILALLAAGSIGVVGILSLKSVSPGSLKHLPAAPAATKPAKLAYDQFPLGDPAHDLPMITHLAIVDLNKDGLPDILVADAQTNQVSWIRQSPKGVFTEKLIGKVAGPAHVAACDIYGTGRLDILVASMGAILPNNDKIGSVVVFENLGDDRFTPHVLLEHVARVTDLRGANLTAHQDGRLDLVVGQFGYDQGEIRWMENLGNWNFTSHLLNDLPGTIHTPLADFNGDNRPDFAALISQDSEQVQTFLNQGNGTFRSDTVWKSSNRAWASSGMEVSDLNRDGKPDLLLANGDGFDGTASTPAWHGLQWLENTGTNFLYHRIGNLPGCYSPAAADLDGDGHLDIVTVSCFNNWKDPAAVSLMAWLNDGNQHFTAIPLAHEPIQLVTVAAGDLDGDGTPELVTGGFHIFAPETGISRITLWRRRK